ncbi:MAG: hypothetical protein GXY76_16485 [Chloroflexi bacterium]|nr:hypothetical protein [Chloroflexota bacterium]
MSKEVTAIRRLLGLALALGCFLYLEHMAPTGGHTNAEIIRVVVVTLCMCVGLTEVFLPSRED